MKSVAIDEKEIVRCISKINDYKVLCIEDILDLLGKKIDIEEAILVLSTFYLVNGRHKYSEVAMYINNESIKDEQSVSFLLSNINRLILCCKSNRDKVNILINQVIEEGQEEGHLVKDKSGEEFDNIKLIEKLEKLNDHIKLEEQRLIFSQQREKSIFSGMINELNKSGDQARSQIENTTKQIKEELSSSVISVLGIFSAVVMVFFGGLNILGNILSSINNASNIRVVFMASLTGLIVFDIVFLLLYFMAKVLDKSMAVNDLNDKFNECYGYQNNDTERDKAVKKYRSIMVSPFRRFKIRYPVAFWFNTLMIIFMIICTVIWGVKTH